MKKKKVYLNITLANGNKLTSFLFDAFNKSFRGSPFIIVLFFILAVIPFLIDNN